MLKPLLAGSVALAGLAESAPAADLIAYEPAPVAEAAPPVFSWTGPYLGVQLGYGWRDDKPDDPSTIPIDLDGFLGGVYGGYNWQSPFGIVLGIEADIAWSGIDGTGVEPGFAATYDVNWPGAVRGRVGYAFDRFLPYIAGGFAFSRHEYEVTFSGTRQGDDKWVTGWTLGAGMEYAFTGNWIGRLEYRYIDFGDFEFDDGIESSHNQIHDVQIGLSYRF